LSKARDAVHNVPSVVDAQQALLDFADVYAAAAHTGAIGNLGAVESNREKELAGKLISSSQELDPLKAEDERLSLTDFSSMITIKEAAEKLARAMILHRSLETRKSSQQRARPVSTFLKSHLMIGWPSWRPNC
jgi:hypothetical protein